MSFLCCGQRNADGRSMSGLIASLTMPIVATALGGFKSALLTKMTGSLYGDGRPLCQ